MALSRRLALVATLAIPTAATAQRSYFADSALTALTINAGRFEYDLDATGKAFMVAARLERPLSRYVIAEGGLLFARPSDVNGNAFSLFVPELQVQFQLPVRGIAPYLGFGGGLVWQPGRDRPLTPQSSGRATDPSFSLSGGARSWITPAVGFRVEVRQRWIGGAFPGSSTEWTIGLAVRDPK
ncbi:MAG: hypothetical protein ACRENU_13030 [Gemmatimonadaceae bacterium]